MPFSRPPLGARAVSDMNPLVSNSPADADKRDLGHGTHATAGGARVASGAPLALGGVAPISPFLPLPPAPSAEEVHRQRIDNIRGSRSLTMTRISAAAGSCENSPAPGSSPRTRQYRATTMPRGAHCAPAPMMIRSYSLPVATQRDYEAQRRAERARRNGNGTTVDDGVGSELCAPEPSTLGLSCETADVTRMPLRTLDATEMNMTRSMSTVRATGAPSQASTRRLSPSASPLSRRTYISDTAAAAAGDESEEADEVTTPRAVSPAREQAKSHDATHDSDETFLHGPLQTQQFSTQHFPLGIHPDHLRPPPFMLS